MMDTRYATNLFHSALAWNGGLHALTRSSGVLLTSYAYAFMIPDDFITWSLIKSFVYISAAWMDFGLRSSIPRYIPSARNPRRFITTILLAKLSICSMLCIIAHYANILPPHLSAYAQFIPFFILSEITLGTIRTIVHASCAFKHYTLCATPIILAERVITWYVITSHVPDSVSLLISMRIALNIIGIIATGYLAYVYLPIVPTHTTQPSQPFIKHTLIMWLTSISHTLSERNAILPFLAATAGTSIVAAYKLANDYALLLQRSLVQSIGTSDTVVLSRFEHPSTRSVIHYTITRGVILAAGAACMILSGLYYYGYDLIIIKLFIILAGGYLAELWLRPYLRVVEVQQRYGLLLASYIPYYLALGWVWFHADMNVLYMLMLLFISKIGGLWVIKRFARKYPLR